MNRLLISVLLPVYNGQAYVKQAIQSILNQTYQDFELIIIDDGSRDGSAAIIQNIRDKRISFYKQSNQGLAATLNRAITLSKGEYLARQDQDDLAHPERFEKQIAFLEKHPDHAMIGSWAIIMEGEKITKRVHKHPAESLILKYGLLFGNPFVHSSMMIRRNVFDDVGLYSTDKSRQPPEDYELWSRIARKYEIANIPEFLQSYRATPNSMCRTDIKSFFDKEILIRIENLESLLGRHDSDKDILNLAALTCGSYEKLTGKVNASEIRNIMYEAADRLSDLNHASYNILRERVSYHFRSIYYHYINYKFGKKIARIYSLWNKLNSLIRKVN